MVGPNVEDRREGGAKSFGFLRDFINPGQLEFAILEFEVISHLAGKGNERFVDVDAQRSLTSGHLGRAHGVETPATSDIKERLQSGFAEFGDETKAFVEFETRHQCLASNGIVVVSGITGEGRIEFAFRIEDRLVSDPPFQRRITEETGDFGGQIGNGISGDHLFREFMLLSKPEIW